MPPTEMKPSFGHEAAMEVPSSPDASAEEKKLVHIGDIGCCALAKTPPGARGCGASALEVRGRSLRAAAQERCYALRLQPDRKEVKELAHAGAQTLRSQPWRLRVLHARGHVSPVLVVPLLLWPRAHVSCNLGSTLQPILAEPCRFFPVLTFNF